MVVNLRIRGFCRITMRGCGELAIDPTGPDYSMRILTGFCTKKT
jgi:hypothetical protein